jgi:hypothetical protein
VPTSPIAIYLIDIFNNIEVLGTDKMHKPDIANCNKFKALALNLNQYNRLRGVAKKNSLLQIVTPCREIRGKKKIQPFYKGRISDYM